MHGLDARRDGVELNLRLGEGYTRFQATKDVVVLAIPLREQVRGERQRQNDTERVNAAERG